MMNSLAINRSEGLACADKTNVVALDRAGDKCVLGAAFQHHATKLRKIREQAKAKLEDTELSVDHAMLLLLMEENCTFSDISQVAYFGSNASYPINHLARLGYIRLRTDTRDRRKRWVRRTQEGREMTERLRCLFAEDC